MSTPREPSWSLLGSSLWLRLMEARDLPQLRAFLKRGDLLRFGNTAAKLEPAASRAPGPVAGGGITLVATDPWGAPSVVLHLGDSRQEDPVLLSFAAPRGDPAALREALRLLAQGLAARSSAAHLVLAAVPAQDSFDAVLLDVGFRREGKTWALALHPKGQPNPERTHAG